MRSTLTRILVGAAIAAAAVGTTAGTAGATTRTHTTLSIVAARSSITAGQTDTVAGQLRAAAGKASTFNQVVELKRYNVKLKKWVLDKASLTGKHGWVHFVVKPARTSRFELVFPGNRELARSHSGVVTIHVRPAKIATSLSIAASPSSIRAGSTTKISGFLTTTAGGKALPKELVFLYRWNAKAKHWAKVAVDVTGPKGGVSFTRKPPAGSVTFELVFFGSPRLAAAHSAPVTVTVNS